MKEKIKNWIQGELKKCIDESKKYEKKIGTDYYYNIGRMDVLNELLDLIEKE